MDAISRRDMLAATAAALGIPLVRVFGSETALVAPPPVESSAAPRFFSAADFALIDELSEMIIPTDDHSPGARAARVAAYIDSRLAESLEADWKARWRAGVLGVNALSTEMHGKRFMQGTPEQRHAVLTRMAAAERDPKTPFDRFFRELKRWTCFGYYTSKIGIHTDQQYKGNTYQQGEYAGYDAV
jgi:hypothetical protein